MGHHLHHWNQAVVHHYDIGVSPRFVPWADQSPWFAEQFDFEALQSKMTAWLHAWETVRQANWQAIKIKAYSSSNLIL